MLASGCGGTPPTTESGVPELALRFEVLDNLQDGPRTFQAALTLTNRGPATLEGQGWELYFNFGRRPMAESFPEGLRLTHVNGDLFKLEPTADFVPLAPGDSRPIPFAAEAWAIKESDAPAGAYVVRDGAPPRTVDVTVAPFTSSQQTDRFDGDLVPVPTAESRFADQEGLRLLPPAEVPLILPTPRRLEVQGGEVTLDAGWEVRHAAGLDGEATFLAAALEPLLGAAPEVAAGDAPEAGAIFLGKDATAGAEGYRLRIGDGVEVLGGDDDGVFYGVQSLLALVPPSAFSGKPGPIVLPAVTVDDAPRFAYRGMHLDVARNFQSKDAVKKLLDLMAFYKLNRFHFHLSDDEGWRLEIEALPELTAVGGRRGHTTHESDRLLPSFGSGPDPDAGHGSGFYTRDDFLDILRYATARHVEVIPEIDVPGHARAAIKAMAARGTPLQDPGDRSEYRSIQMWNDNVVDVCLPATWTFLETVVDEIFTLYAEADAPLDAIHTGGDEVPHGVWERSPACAELIASDPELESTADLPGWFLKRLSIVLAKRGIETAGWEEIALTVEGHGEDAVKVPNPALLDYGLLPYVWNNVWGWNGEDVAYKLANAGYQVVLSNATNLYFDLAYDKDPAEPGYYWAAFVDTRKAWELVPLDLYRNARFDRYGKALDPASYAGRERLTDAGRGNVRGIQGQLWGENALGQARMEYLAFPKLLGLAERAWAASPDWAETGDPDERRRLEDEAWNVFVNTLGQRELPRLDALFGGVAYRLPPPGAVVRGGVLEANVAFPGLEVRYTQGGSEPTASSALYTGPVEVSTAVKLRSFDRRGRSSRTVEVEP